jgi:hypothetical protein
VALSEVAESSLHGLAAPSFARGRTGRIVEVRVRRLADVGEVEALNEQVMAAVRRAGPGAVICADHRLVGPLSREVADAWARGMRGANGAIARGGLLLDPANAMFNLQVERVVHCAGNPARRLFSDVEELRSWVSAVLTEPEREALRTLFSGGG